VVSDLDPIGYIVTVSRLAQGGVATNILIDDQYFAGGLLPAILLWLTLLVVLSEYPYEPRKQGQLAPTS
jgi:hypothetical protein